MKELPILFQAAMIRALLAGTKTQTRRAVKLPHMNPLGQWEPTTFGGPDGGRTRDGKTIPEHAAIWHTRTGDQISARWIVGDRLWARESMHFADGYWRYSAGGGNSEAHDADYVAARGPDAESAMVGWMAHKHAIGIEHCPSIHMPRWASRILLDVTGVRVERLQAIGEVGALAEGIVAHRKGGWHVEQPPEGIEGTNHFGFKIARDAYRALWENINGAGSWDANPWVWVIEFRRVKP